MLLVADRASRHYRGGSPRVVRAVDDVSLAIARGDFAALAGHSGSGKSTLLSLLGALDRPTSGRVVFDGRDLTSASDVELARLRRRVGFVFQSFSLLPRMPVWESATYGLIPSGVSRRERQKLAAKVFERLGISDKLASRPEELSGGEQQRVAVARALVADPVLLLADEPTSNLDRRSAADLIALLGELHAGGLTIVTATHDPHLLSLATRPFTMDHGKLVDGPAT
jgi:putative ABC transport system ATP-binding protein